MDCCPPGSSVCGILQARILEWVSMSFFRGLPNPGMEHESPVSSALQAGSLPIYFNFKKRLWNFEWYSPFSEFQHVTAQLSFFLTHHFLRLFKINLFMWLIGVYAMPVQGNWSLERDEWKSLIRVRLFATPWTIQFLQFSRPGYWSG